MFALLNAQMLGIYNETELSLSLESSEPGRSSAIEMVYVGSHQGASLPE